MAGKIKNMVATAPRRPVGRPRKLPPDSLSIRLRLSPDLREAAERHKEKRRFEDLTDAVRDLLREAAEARGLVKPRE